MAAAAGGDHVVVLLEHDVLVFVEVEEADGEELVGHAARRSDSGRQAELVDDALHRGVVGGQLVLTEREGALALAVVGVVALGRDDPARPADLLEVHVHLVAGAVERLPVRVADLGRGPGGADAPGRQVGRRLGPQRRRRNPRDRDWDRGLRCAVRGTPCNEKQGVTLKVRSSF